MKPKIKLIRLLILFLFLSLPAISFAKTEILNCEYDISGVSIAKEGSYLVEVSVFVNKKKDANLAIAKQYALLGCLYKGFVVDRINQQPMLSMPLTEKTQEEYINNLIIQDYNKYTSSSHPIQIIKVGKRYKVSAVILVAKDALRQTLENAGIIRKLGLF